MSGRWNTRLLLSNGSSVTPVCQKKSKAQTALPHRLKVAPVAERAQRTANQENTCKK